MFYIGVKWLRAEVGGDALCFGETRCRPDPAAAELPGLRAEEDSAAGAATVGVLAMSLTNMPMASSTTAVTTVSSQSISRCTRRRLRRRDAALPLRARGS